MILYELRAGGLEGGDGSLVFTPISIEAVLRAAGETRRVLNFPWLGQNTPAGTDDLSANDCGPAALAMWLNGLGQTLTVDDVSRATGLAANYGSTAYWDLTKAARQWNLVLSRKAGLTIDLLRSEIDRGTPLIVLVHYASLPKRATSFEKGHWVLVVGYDAGNLIYHDPLFVDSRGAYVACPNESFAKAMADCAIDKNTPNQGLVRLLTGK